MITFTLPLDNDIYAESLYKKHKGRIGFNFKFWIDSTKVVGCRFCLKRFKKTALLVIDGLHQCFCDEVCYNLSILNKL